MSKINVTRSSMPPFDEYVEEIKELWETHWLTNSGSKHCELQKRLQEYLRVKNVVLYTNGHLALEAIWEHLDFPEGSEVITTPFTFCSTVHAFARKGLVPIFCDVEPNTYCIDAEKIESLITDKTVAICPVHVYGNMCNVEKIKQIAQKHKLKVVYDAAHAFGVKYNGVSCANFGDFSMFSFHATKVYNTIEGGSVCFNGDSLEEDFNARRNFGMRGPETVPFIGGNAKMNEFQAAMGICNLRHIDEEISKRKTLVERYRERLEGHEGIAFSKTQEGVTPNYAYLPVLFDGFKKNRDMVFEELASEGIVARKYFYPIVNSMECYQDLLGCSPDDTPVAKHLGEHVLTLPLYAGLSLADVDHICDIILR